MGEEEGREGMAQEKREKGVGERDNDGGERQRKGEENSGVDKRY